MYPEVPQWDPCHQLQTSASLCASRSSFWNKRIPAAATASETGPGQLLAPKACDALSFLRAGDKVLVTLHRKPSGTSEEKPPELTQPIRKYEGFNFPIKLMEHTIPMCQQLSKYQQHCTLQSYWKARAVRLQDRHHLMLSSTSRDSGFPGLWGQAQLQPPRVPSQKCLQWSRTCIITPYP